MKKIFVLICLTVCIGSFSQEKNTESTKSNFGIEQIIFSPTENIFITVHQDNSIHLRSSGNKQTIHSLKPTQWTNFVTISADGKYLAFGNARSSIWIWDIDANRLKDSIACDVLEPQSICFNPQENLLAYAERKGDVKIWDLNQKKVVYLSETEPGCAAMVFSPDGKTLAVDNLREVILWDYQSNQKKYLQGHQKRAKKIVFSPDGQTVATGSHDKKIRFYDYSVSALRRVIEVDYPGDNCLCNHSLSYSPDGSLFAYLNPWSVIKILDPSDWNLVNERDENQITDFAFSPDGKYMLYGMMTGEIRKIEF